jgi:CHAT domain-containing protein
VTGELSFLPIHAAGETRYGVLECAADYFVSSYVPTLSALTKSRAGLPSFPRNEVTGILAACRNSPHQPRLDNVEKEVEIAMDCFTRASARILHSLSPNVSSTLLQEAFLAQKSAHVLHLACHGVQEENPLESAFLLSDGRVTIETLMHIHGPDALLAFLSACQTAKGSADQPDQAVHLAASMLFGGFRSVVGTMW